jgi:hypothetical protein
MATNYNPKIATDGLVLCLDAANPKSYPGTGTTWTDVSGNGNNGTLVNGVGYNSDNLGSLSFDQINDNVNLGNVSLSTSSLSVSAWIYDTDTSGSYRDFVTKAGHFKFRIDNNPEGGNLSCFVWIAGNPEPRISASWTKNVWTNVAFTWNTDGNFRLFTNSVLRSSSTTRTGTLNTTTNDFTIGSDRTSQYWKGNISNVLVYNKTLTDLEVQQNFNALRGRYGI